MAKTIKVSDNINGDKYYSVPCNDTSIYLNEEIETIPSTWVEISAATHNSSQPCLAPKVLRIFCP